MVNFTIPQKCCTKCKQLKNLSEFPKRKEDKWCRECKNQSSRELHAKGGKLSRYLPEKHRKRYNELKEQGLCVTCKVLPARSNRIHCGRCAPLLVEKQRQIRIKAKAAGLCSECAKRSSLSTNPMCERCYIKSITGRNLGTRTLANQVLEKLRSQNFQCAYTKETIVLGVNDSIDHVQPVSRFPELKSEISNIEWVTRRINTMKGDFTRSEFLDTMSLILNNH